MGEQIKAVLEGHMYGEFLSSLGEAWTTCSCGVRIDATFGDGLSSFEVFRRNWVDHLAEQVDRLLDEARYLHVEAGAHRCPDGTGGTEVFMPGTCPTLAALSMLREAVR